MTKENLIAEIRKFDPEAELDELNHADLIAKLSEMKAKVAKEATIVEILGLEPEAELDGLDQVELTAKLAGLKPDPKAGAENAASAKEKAQEEKAGKAKQVKARKPPYHVAPGKAITTKRGILAGKSEDEPGEETEIKKRDLSDGGTSLEKFIKLGHIIRG